MTTAVQTDAAGRLAELSAEVKLLEQRQRELLEERAQGRSPAALEAAGRRLAAGEPVEAADVDGELRRVEGRLEVVQAAVRALGVTVQREDVARRMPGVREAKAKALAHLEPIYEALVAVEKALAAAGSDFREYERRHGEVAGPLLEHPDLGRDLLDYQVDVLRYGLLAEFRRQRAGAGYASSTDRPTREQQPSGLDRWWSWAVRELGVELPARRLPDGMPDPNLSLERR